jgi:alpha-tubulin suppressor-like RCC1 family protein
MTSRYSAATLLLLSLSACQDQLLIPAPGTEADAPPAPLAALRCEANVHSGAFACESTEGGGYASGARFSRVTVGGQHHYVRLANSGTAVDAVAGTFTTTVTVQNLLLAALGTHDGTTPHASGVRVFFASGPTNGVTVANPSGQDLFLSGSQPYFQYSGAELGDDGVLRPDETSAGKAWVFDTNGASSFSFTVYVQARIPTGTAPTAHFVEVSAGGEHSCAVTEEGNAYCWGSDSRGQLGNGVALTADQGVPSPVQMPTGVVFASISAGFDHTCALAADGRAYCWGRDDFGQLGNGAGLSGDQRVPTPVVMPEDVSFTRISAGGHHTCAQGSNSRLYCWGWNSYGQVGGAGVEHVVAPFAVREPFGFGPLTGVDAGGQHTCAVGRDGFAWCWGNGSHGQLGNGAQIAGGSNPRIVMHDYRFASVAAGERHSCGIDLTGEAVCWGSNDWGQMGNPNLGAELQLRPAPVSVPRITGITTKGVVSCGMGVDGHGYCWGDRLGSPARVRIPEGASITSITAGFSSSCSAGSGPSYCWGYNSKRQMGNGRWHGDFTLTPNPVAGTR